MNKHLAQLLVLLTILFGFSFSGSSVAYAAGSFLCPGGSIKVPGFSKDIPCDDTQALVGWFFQFSIWIAASLAVLLVVLGGYYVMTSTGDPGRINRGKEIITNALIGLVFITLSGVILRFIGNVLIGLPST